MSLFREPFNALGVLTTPMIVQGIGTGGTPTEALFDTHMAVVTALEAAIEAMARITPNARDYVTGDGYAADQFRLYIATLGWRQRRDVLVQLKEDIREHSAAIWGKADMNKEA